MAAQPAAQPAISQGKLILIGVLAAVLVAVVYWNYFRDATQRTAASSEAAEAGSQPAAPAASGGRRDWGDASPGGPVADVNAGPRKVWPEFKLAEVIARDPFALPETFPQPRPTLPPSLADADAPPPAARSETAANQERADVLAAIKEQGVQLVFQNGQEYVAKIGERQLRVGDKIGGMRVVDISLRGVLLERDVAP